MSQNTSLFFLMAAALIAVPAAAQDDAPQDVFIVEPSEPAQQQPAQQQPAQDYQPAPTAPQPGAPYQQPQQGYPAQPQGYQPAPTAPQPGAPVYQPYQPQPRYSLQANPGRLRRVPYIEGMSLPPGGVLVERRRKGLVISGAVMFGAPWLLTLSTGVAVEEGLLGIPVVGPLLYVGVGDGAADALLIMDSVIQGTGITLFILGMVMKKRYVEYYGESDNGRQWSLLPQVGTTNGLQLDMRF